MILSIPLAFLAEWVERKITAKIQRRIGPPILQPFYDFLKLLEKENLKLGFEEEFLVPILLIFSTGILLFLFSFLPFPKILISFEGDLIFIVFTYSLVSFFIVLLGYLLPSPFSNIGAGRLIQMFISFEIPFIISIATIVSISESVTLKEIIEKQTIPFVLIAPISFAVYLISSLAKLSLTPFEISDAYTEIAGGWKCEMSGRCLALARLIYDLELLFLSSFGALLFFGGGNFFVFLLKSFLILLILVSLKNTSARLRVDQAIYLFWRGAIPLSLIQLLIIVLVRNI